MGVEPGEHAALDVALVRGIVEPVRLGRIFDHLRVLSEHLQAAIEFEAQSHRYPGVTLAMQYQDGSSDIGEHPRRRLDGVEPRRRAQAQNEATRKQRAEDYKDINARIEKGDMA